MKIENILKMKSRLIVVSGISASGKTMLAESLKHVIKCNRLSMDDYKEKIYEEYGFNNEYERKLLWNMAKYRFQADIIINLRKNNEIIIDYAFDTSWQLFLDYLLKEYKANIIIINCNSRPFESIWASRVARDSDYSRRPKCLTASSYIKDKHFISNGKLNEEYKEKKREEYNSGKYTSLKAEYILSDLDVYNGIQRFWASKI